jgi:hypothetical protein
MWDASFMTASEAFLIETTINAINSSKYSCSNCARMINHEKIKENQGCTKAKPYIVLESATHKFYKCPGSFIISNIGDYISMADIFSKGINPFGGAYLSITNKLAEHLEYIDALIIKRQKDELREWQTKSKSRSR